MNLMELNLTGNNRDKVLIQFRTDRIATFSEKLLKDYNLIYKSKIGLVEGWDNDLEDDGRRLLRVLKQGLGKI